MEEGETAKKPPSLKNEDNNGSFTPENVVEIKDELAENYFACYLCNYFTENTDIMR